jgi:hypothetical protein
MVSKPNWLDLLPQEVELTDVKPGDPLEPASDVEDNDHQVSVLGDDLKRMYILAVRQKKKSAEIVVEAQYTTDRDERTRLFCRAKEFKEKGEILQRIFWAAVRDQFQLWDKPIVGVRRGWVVVWSDHEGPTIINLLGGLGLLGEGD